MDGKLVLVTGATKGFGKLTVRLLLERGHRVIAGVRGGQERLEEIFAEEIKRHSAGRLFGVDLHLDRPESIRAVAETIDRDFGGRLDALVNNAGFMLLGEFEAQTEEEIEKQFEVNFFGVMRLTRALIPAIKRAHGRILNISSVAGLGAFPFYGTYNASKHALEAHTEGLYYDLLDQGVQVGLIEPGSFRTEIVNAAVFGSAASDPGSPYYKSSLKVRKSMEAIFRFGGDPMRVAKLIVRRVEQRRIPIRSLIGIDAWLMVILRRLLPERVRVRFVAWMFSVMLKSG
jgi:NAD(P)-dependent dehydrogenase (short-subunit alcohol dehydrogenase family)